MGLHLKDNFSASQPITAVPASWFNSVAKFINGLIPGDNVSFEKHADGSPTIVEAHTQGEKTTPDPTKGVSAHPDYYDYPDYERDHTLRPPDLEQRYDMPNGGGNEYVPPARLTGADNVTPVGWERGKTAWKNGHDVDADHPAVGLSMTVCTHFRIVPRKGRQRFFRRCSRGWTSTRTGCSSVSFHARTGTR